MVCRHVRKNGWSSEKEIRVYGPFCAWVLDSLLRTCLFCGGRGVWTELAGTFQSGLCVHIQNGNLLL
jgi:hypothetical protein